MSSMNEETQVRAQVLQEITVNIRLNVNDRSYVLMIPAGSPFEEAYVVALEMSSVIKQMQEKSKADAAAQGESDAKQQS